MATKPVLVDLDFGSNAKVINLPTPTAGGDAATKSYVDSAIEGLAWKESARVATQANLNLASPGASIDGITMALSDRVLVRAQSVPNQNGIYIWNGAAVAMTRAPDGSTFAELEQAILTVEEGTSAGASFRQTAVNGTIDSSDVAFAAFGTSAPAATDTTPGIAEIATQTEVNTGTDNTRFVTPQTLANWSGRIRKHAATIGDGSNVSYTVTHNFNTRDVQVSVYQNSGTYDAVLAEIEHTDANSVTVKFNTAPASNALRVVVVG
jgi:hypothetical protein